MAEKCVVNKSTLTDIADAIREKGGTSAAMLPSAMPAAIEAIPTGGITPETLQVDDDGNLYCETDRLNY